MREEKWKEAFSSIAMDEADQLEKSITFEERKQAESLYKHHRNTVLRSIRKKKGSAIKWTFGLSAVAAAVLLIIWGMHRPVPDIITPAVAPVSTVTSTNTNEPVQTQTAAPAVQTVDPTPSIPALEAHLVNFQKGKRYAVYTGPGEQYERANHQKAVVSTNDWIEVYGIENGYAMIQYAITSTQRRIGYIEETALPANAAVANLEFSHAPVTITKETELTDDPNGEKASLHVLPVGTEAEWLATMDDWVYLEWKGRSQPVRGFVPASVVCLKSDE